MPDQKILDDINTRVDSQKLENYFPFEKERELGEIVKKLRAEDDKETEKYVQMEWMLLNNAFGYGITDKWKYVLEQIELGEKPDFWTYTKETVEYFKKRKQGKIPPIGRARINYYLWTATKDFGYAKDAINDFEIAMEEHSATNEVGYAQTGLFCGKIALKMMVAFGQTERIETLFLPKLMVLINNVSVPHLQREFVNLGFICIQTIRKKDESRGTGEAQQLMDISKKTILEFVRVAEYHQAIMWLDQLEHFAKEMKDSNLSCDLQQQHLLIMIADAEQGSSQLIKCSFYQAALTYFQTMTVKDKAIEQKLKQALAESMEKSNPEFKTVQASFTSSHEKIDLMLEQICGDIENSARIVRLADILIPREELVSQVMAARSSGLASLLPKVVQTKDHMSKAYSSEEERKKYSSISATAFILQYNEIYISRALEKYNIISSDFTDLIEKNGLRKDSKEILKHGIERHFEGDYISSMHILCPNIEELLRHIIRENGGETISFDQKTKAINQELLSALIRDDLVKNALGVAACNAIDSYFANPDFHKLRHKISHGLIELDELNKKNSIITIFTIVYILSKMRACPATS